MKNKEAMIRGLILTVAVMLSAVTGAMAQSVAKDSLQVKEVITGAANQRKFPEYKKWNTVQLSGKLRMSGIPVSPTVNVSMVCDREIFLSVRAPFMGEIGRMSITKDTIVVVNKLKRVYAVEDAKRIGSVYPDFLADLQSLFLARPVARDGYSSLVYENFFNDNETLRKMAITLTDSNFGSASMSALYEYYSKLYDIYLTVAKGNRKIEVIFNMDNLQWDVPAPDVISVPVNYRKVSAREVIKF